MARRRKSSLFPNSFVLNHYKLASLLLIIGGLYFFSYFLAENSPLMSYFKQSASWVFGFSGIHFFFALCILYGILIFYKPRLLSAFIKQFIVISILLSGLLNFPIIDGVSRSYPNNGGYISQPLLFGLEALFGNQNPLAIKVLIILLVLGTLVWVVITLNITLPKIALQIPKNNDRPESREDKKSSRKNEDSGPRHQERQIREKIREARSSYDVETKPEKKSGWNLLFGGDESEAEDTQKPVKELIRNSLKEKLEEKIHAQMYMQFADDKPTFALSLLDKAPPSDGKIDESYLAEKAKSLQNKLAEFDVPVHIEGFDIGPSVVQIKIKPQAGIKISQIEALKNDITSATKAKSLRIIAPIPGTDLVGIEIPNPKPQMVVLGEVLGSSEFIRGMGGDKVTNLTLGKGIDGQYVVKALESMPHLLVAGATGSGKSVGINDFILSLIYQNSPSELKFLMVDPKQVELEFYSGLPYLLAPIVTKPDNALKILKRSVDEMERRYDVLKNTRVKNIQEYNQKNPAEKMYRIVVVIDELADLMMSGSKKDVELCITRIAQKARAVGMHLIVATQRPSVNVITGLIKANIPTRIAFGVVSQIDSRTILDMKGAEDLVGKGDMLYIDPTTKYPIRVQAPFVGTFETERVIDALKNRYMKGLNEQDIYHPEIMSILEGRSETGNSLRSAGGGSDDDDLLDEAIQIIMETRKASTTLLQRKLGIGFARAGKIMDILEERGIVGPQDGAKPREIYL